MLPEKRTETPEEEYERYKAFLIEAFQQGTLTHAMVHRLCTFLGFEDGVRAISVVDSIGGIQGIENGPEGLTKILRQRSYLYRYIESWSNQPKFNTVPSRKKFFSLFAHALFEQNAAELLLFRPHTRDDRAEDADLQKLLRPQTEAVRVRKPIQRDQKAELDLEINDLCRAVTIFIAEGIPSAQTLIPASFHRCDFLTMARRIVELAHETGFAEYIFITPPGSPDEIDALAERFGFRKDSEYFYYVNPHNHPGEFFRRAREFDRAVAHNIFYQAFSPD